jgi:uncharacterized protein
VDNVIAGIEPSAADTVADGVSRQLDPRWVGVRRLHAAVAGAIFSIASFAALMILWAASGAPLLLLVPLWLLLVSALAWHLYRWPAIAHRCASYRVDDNGLEILRGVYWRTITNVPRSRVQHTDVSQGPLERRHGLGTLVVFTAGTQHSEVKLRGLDFGVARRIRAHLLPGSESDAV